MKENFKYNELAKMTEGFSSLYAVTKSGPFWCLWSRELLAVQNKNSSQEETWENIGWKIHISLSTASENIEKAWDEIVNFLMLYGVKACKVLDTAEEWPAFQWGKEITLYFHAEVVHWQELLDEITKKFIEAGIEPNYLAISDRPVEGSVFFSCRNDEGSDGKYVDGLHCANFNPSNRPFPQALQRLKITHVNQPLKPIRKNEELLKEYYRGMRDMLQLVSRGVVIQFGTFSERFKSISASAPIWGFSDIIMERACLEFSEPFKSTLLSQLKEIRELHKVSCQDFGRLDLLELKNMQESFFQRLDRMEKVIAEVEKEIRASKISPGADRLAPAIGEFNSGNVSSASSEGSPVKAGSSEDASPRSAADNERDMVVRSPQKK